MNEECFPIWEKLSDWNSIYQFFYIVSTKQKSYKYARKIIERILLVIFYFKLTICHELVYSLGYSKFSTVFGKLIYQFITLDFFGAKYIALLMLCFGIVFTAFVLFYYSKFDRLYTHHTCALICFCIQTISPLFVAYLSSILQLTIAGYLHNEYTLFALIIVSLSFLIFTIYSFLGSYFKNPFNVSEFCGHALWNQGAYFNTFFISCLVQQLWTLIDFFEFGIFCCLYTNLAIILIFYIYLGYLPYMSKYSNTFAFSVAGQVLTTLLISISFHHYNFNPLIVIISLIANFFIWNYVLCYYYYDFIMYLFKLYYNEDYNLINIDYDSTPPVMSERKSKYLIRYLWLNDFPEINQFLICLLEQELSYKMTLECSILLQFKKAIPCRIRERLFQFDRSLLSIRERFILFTLLNKLNRLQENSEDIRNISLILENQKQKVKIALYNFANTLIESKSYRSIYIDLLNYTLQTYKFKLMADYAMEGNPTSTELQEIYSDYLMKYDGDFVRRERLLTKDKSKYLLIKKAANDENTLKLNTPEEEHIEEFETTYNLYHQKAIDLLPIYPVVYLKILATLLSIVLIFPIYSTSLYIKSSKFVPAEYFKTRNSPSFFKITLSLENINKIFSSFNETLLESDSPFNVVNKITFRSIKDYLDSFICPSDQKPIVSGASDESVEYLDILYNILSNRLISYTDDENGWHSLRETHSKLRNFTLQLQPVIDRYFSCSKLIVNEKYSLKIQLFMAVSVFFLLWLLFFVTYIPKRYLKKIINVLKGIENSTLEEFRSNLFITLNTLMYARKNNNSSQKFEIDNDGALDLEELEVADHNHHNDTVDPNHLDMQQPFSVGLFDPARHYTYFLYTILIFGLKSCAAIFVFWGMNLRKASIVGDSIMLQDKMDHFSELFIEIDALMSNVTGVIDELVIVPQKTYLHEDHEYSQTMKVIFDKWNVFVDNNTGSYTFNETKDFIQEMIEDSMNELDVIIRDQYKTFELVSIRYFDFMYWFITCILICVYILMSFRFIAYMYIMMSNARHIAIIIHSKYSPTVSNLVSALTPQIRSNKSINVIRLCETVVTQMRDPVIFFDAELVITGCNQQASADLGYRVDDLQGRFLEHVLEERRNKPFYEFVCSMFTPLGVCCKRLITVYARANDMSLIEYNAMLIPILNDHSVYRINGRGELTHFALLMRNQNVINSMKNELTQLENHVNVQLRRLVPHPIASKMIDGTIQPQTTVERCAFLVATTKTYNESISDEDKVFATEDITEVFMSHIDKIIPKYKDIVRIRTFNGVFFFVCGFYEKREDKENLNTLFNFTKDVAKSITASLDSYNVPILLSFTIKCGGPAHAFLSGISKLLYDFYSETMVEAFEISDVVPCGKVMITKEEYDALDDKSDFVKYNPERDVGFKLYVNHGLIGIE